MQKPIRIVRVITRLNIGGPAIHVALLSAKLDQQRFSTCLVTGEPEASEGDLSSVVRAQKTRLIRVKALRRPLHLWRDVRAYLTLTRILWNERPHIIHTHMAKAGFLGRLAGLTYNRLGPGRKPGARAVFIHTFHGHVLEGYFPVWLSRLFVKIERWLGKRTDCLIAVSNTVRDQLVGMGIGRPERWRVVSLGRDISALRQLAFPDHSSAIRIGFIGRLVPIKNPSLFLHAFHRLKQQRPVLQVQGIVVGDGPLRQALEDEARQLGLNGMVRFVGWQQDVQAVYDGLEATCLTSWNEGTPLALIEAMAAGRPVIATDVGGVRDLLGSPQIRSHTTNPDDFQLAERGILVRPGDSESLAAALSTVVSDAILRRQLGEAGRAYVTAHFSEERLLRDITALYQGIEQQRES